MCKRVVRQSALVFLFSAICLCAGAQEGVTALVEALASDEPAVREAAFKGAGQYGADAAGPIAALLDDPRPAVQRAARLALEDIVSDVLEQPFRRAATANALCRAARVVKNNDWLLHLLSYAGLPDNLEALTWMLGTRPESTDGILRAVVRIAGSIAPEYWPRDLELAGKLLGHMRHTGGARRAAFINALGDLRMREAVPELLEEARAGGEPGRAAIRALGFIGDRRAVGVLREAMLEGEFEPALAAYLRVAGQQSVKEAAAMYAELLDLSASQTVERDGEPARVVTSLPVLVCAALEGLGRTATRTRDIQRMAGYLEVDRADVHGAAVEALVALPGDGATQTLAKMARRADPPLKTGLLAVLAARDPETARELLDSAAESQSAEVRLSAIRLLGALPAQESVELFLDTARGEEGVLRDAAVEAYLAQAARALAADEKATALEMFQTGLALAGRDEERRMALAGLAAIAAPESLEALEPFHGQPGIAPDVQRCELAVAERVHGSRPAEARAIYERVLDAGLDRALCNRAADGLRAMGVEVDAAARGGFITHWQLIGPFDMPDFAASYPPEEEYDADAVYEGKDSAKVSWQPLDIDDVMGIATLDRLLSPKNDAIAYARAEVTVAEASDILVKAGSDDMVAIWVNGELAHHNDARRAVKVDDDVKPARLKAGGNVVLVKVGNGGGDWEFCVRLTGRQGKPLDFDN